MQRFAAAISQCDVILDSIGCSGCNSTLESLPHDLPLVTMMGAFMRGRHTSAILEMMGVTETIAGRVDDYVAIAVGLADDPQWRAAMRARISQSKRRVYRDTACISENARKSGPNPHAIEMARATTVAWFGGARRGRFGLGENFSRRLVIRCGWPAALFKILARLMNYCLTKGPLRLRTQSERVFFVQHLAENSPRRLLEAAFFIA